MNEPLWLEWARQLQAIAQIGLHYTKDPFDKERFQQVQSIAIDIYANHPIASNEPLEDVVQADHGYMTPKIDTRAIILNARGELLMVRENLDGGRWSVPGGWADVNNSPSQNVEREVLEESGFVVRATRLLAVLDRRLHHYPPNMFSIYKLFFLCELLSDTPTISPQGTLESSEWRFFAPHDVPAEAELSAGRIQRAQLLDLLARANDPTLPTLFD